MLDVNLDCLAMGTSPPNNTPRRSDSNAIRASWLQTATQTNSMASLRATRSLAQSDGVSFNKALRARTFARDHRLSRRMPLHTAATKGAG